MHHVGQDVACLPGRTYPLDTQISDDPKSGFIPRTFMTLKTYRSSPPHQVAQAVTDGSFRLQRHDVGPPLQVYGLAVGQLKRFTKVPGPPGSHRKYTNRRQDKKQQKKEACRSSAARTWALSRLQSIFHLVVDRIATLTCALR